MNINKILFISSNNILKNIKDFLASLTMIDVVFFFAVVLLMVLIVTLLYFIKLNEESKTKEEYVEEIENSNNNLEEEKAEENYYNDEEGELLDLAAITKALENKENDNIDLTAFEEEQEKDAIISYDELINKTKNGTINYLSENTYDDLTVKEVDLNNLINESTKNEVEYTKSQVISYAQEEAFLEALKQLQKQIN